MADRIAEKLRTIRDRCLEQGEKNRWTAYYQKIVLLGVFLCLALCVICRGDLKESTTYESLEYIVSGQAADYKEQMNLQTELMMEDGVEDVIIPMINDVQGPLMHMPVTADETAWTNGVTAKFYGKESVIAIPREEWMEKYGEYK